MSNHDLWEESVPISRLVFSGARTYDSLSEVTLGSNPKRYPSSQAEEPITQISISTDTVKIKRHCINRVQIVTLSPVLEFSFKNVTNIADIKTVCRTYDQSCYAM